MKFFNIFRKTEKRQYNPHGYEFRADTLTYKGDPEKALEVNTVHACVNIIASSIARLPLNLYVKTKDGSRDKAVKHPLYRIFKDPNPVMTEMAFMNAVVQNLLLYGNAYISKKKTRNNFFLSVIPSRNVTITEDKDRKIVYRISTHRDPLTGKEDFRETDSSEIIHIVGESFDGIHGISPVSKLTDTIEFAKTIELFGKYYFENGAYPSGMIVHPGKLSDEARERLKKAIDKFRGVRNSSKVMVLEENARFETGQVGNDSSQFLQTKENLVEEIARIFNVPLHLIQKTDKATSWGTGIEQMGINFVTFTLGAHIARITQAVNKGLLSEKERELYYFEFETKDLLRGDQKGRYESYKIGLNCGFMSPNEVRQKENMPPIDGGDNYFVPLNQGVLEEDGIAKATGE